MFFLNENFIGELCDDEKSSYDGGYMFLHNDGGTTGLIRMYSRDSNLKWSFGKKMAK